MNKIIRLGIFSLSIFILFSCKQNAGNNSGKDIGKSFKVTYSVEGEKKGTLSAMKDNKPVLSGKEASGSVVFTAEPDSGYMVKEWKLEGGKKTAGGNAGDLTMTVEINSAVDVKVFFEIKQHVVNYSVEGNGGTLAAKVGNNGINTGASVDSSSQVVFTATPSSTQYEVQSWDYTGGEKVAGGANGSRTLTMKATSDITVKVIFKTKASGYTVTFAVDGEGGTIKAQPDGESETGTSPINNVPSGKKITFKATANSGFKVGEWTGLDEVNEGVETVEVTLTSNLNVKVSFQPLAFSWKLSDDKKILLGYKGDQPKGDVTLPDGIEEVGADALNGCAGITKVTFPATCKKISSGAFSDCTKLETLVFTQDSALEEVEANTFTRCTALKSFHISKKLIKIHKTAFTGCTSLATITVAPDHPKFRAKDNIVYSKEEKTKKVYEGGKWVDKQIKVLDIILVATGIETANIVAKIDSFGDDYPLTEIPAGAFQDLKKLKTVVVPDSCTKIGNNAFTDCSELSTVTLPDGLKDGGDSAFEKCVKLTSIILGTKLESIGTSMFKGCSALQDIQIRSTELETIGTFAFKDIKAGATFKVKKGKTVANTEIKKMLLKCKSDIQESQIEEVDAF